jgi:transcription antitermination factor NusG
VDDVEMAAVQAVVRSGFLAQPFPFLKVGQSVIIEEGPLRNVSGILTRMQGAEQLVVSVSLLQRSLAVTLPRRAIRPSSDGTGWVPLQQATRT